jgi:hypothetical protein
MVIVPVRVALVLLAVTR